MIRQAFFCMVVVAAVVLLCAGQDTAVPQDVQSLADGFYYKTAQGWQKLEPLSMAGGGLKHAGKMFVPGLTPQFVWTFRGAEARIQIGDKRRRFTSRNCQCWRASLAVLSGIC